MCEAHSTALGIWKAPLAQQPGFAEGLDLKYGW
jgi:hypothetical protein